MLHTTTSTMAPLDLSDMPTEYTVITAGSEYVVVKDLNLQESFEVFAAVTLKARLSKSQQKGFDLYQSQLFPEYTFQIKVSHVWANDKPRMRTIREKQYLAIPAPVWSFLGSEQHAADWYLLFGIDMSNSVFPFILSHDEWLKKSSLIKASNKRFLKMPAQSMSKCGKGYRHNRIWEHAISDWPAGHFQKLSGSQ